MEPHDYEMLINDIVIGAFRCTTTTRHGVLLTQHQTLSQFVISRAINASSHHTILQHTIEHTPCIGKKSATNGAFFTFL